MTEKEALYMQPPLEKANKLLDEFMDLEDDDGFNISGRLAKQCALIAVDKIHNINTAVSFEFIDYWKEVKQEIENL